MDPVTLGMAKADAKKRFTPLAASASAPRPARPIAADVAWYPPVGQGNARIITPTSRARLGLIVRNLSTTQTLKIAVGTLDADSTAPASGTYLDVPPGFEYVTGDARPVWAYFPTTSELVQVRSKAVA